MRLTVPFFAAFLVTVSLTSSAFGSSQTILAVIRFDTPLTQTKIDDVQFGSVKSGQAGTYVISTSGAIVPSAGGVWLHGNPTAAKIVVSGSSTQVVTISTGGYVADKGVTPSSATCKYGASTATTCDAGLSCVAPGAATTLLVGLQVVADGTQTAGTVATPSFAVSLVYN